MKSPIKMRGALNFICSKAIGVTRNQHFNRNLTRIQKSKYESKVEDRDNMNEYSTHFKSINAALTSIDTRSRDMQTER